MGQCPYRSIIPPTPYGTSRPLWSVMIPTYNCAKYLPQTLTSVLVQDPGPDVMQIEVIDDYSTDNPETVANDLGHGRVNFYRQPENVGHIKNFETCLRRSRGMLIHLLHGDDCVRDGFYQKMQQAFDENPEIGAAFCRQIFMDEHGHWQGISDLEQLTSGILHNGLERLAVEQRIMTPSIVVRRDVYEILGGFDRRLMCSEDWEMWVRVAAHYLIWYEVEPLAVYRMHTESNTGRHVRNGEDVIYTHQAIEIIKKYLPSESAEKLSAKAKETYALSALDIAYSMLTKRDMPAAIAQTREAFKLSYSLKVIQRFIQLLIRAQVRGLHKRFQRRQFP